MIERFHDFLSEAGSRMVIIAKDIGKIKSRPYSNAAEAVLAAVRKYDNADRPIGHEFDVAMSDSAAPHQAENMAKRRADDYLKGIYGDIYHTDGSARARRYALSLASIPEEWHHIAVDHMRRATNGGIWLGKSRLMHLGHPAWSPHTPNETPRGARPGRTLNDLAGAYDPNHRALLLGGGSSVSINTAGHEFGHAIDDALGGPSQDRFFTEVHLIALSEIRRFSPYALDYFSQPDSSGQISPAGKEELFAESFGWNYGGDRSSFYSSSLAARHLRYYYDALESGLGFQSQP